MEADTSKYCQVKTLAVMTFFTSGEMRVGNKLWMNWNKGAFKIMANSIEICSILCIERLQG